ncbi:hypothetical protein [Nocardia sp. NPDC051570]|uniref:hypothetical protein n=1 Tax=Nocardia sp. NPDC051570 TaxID=3364324 RepID=UPI0037904D46
MSSNSFDPRATTPLPRPCLFPLVPLLCLIPVAWLSAGWSFGRISRWFRRRSAPRPVRTGFERISRRLDAPVLRGAELYERPRPRTPVHST